MGYSEDEMRWVKNKEGWTDKVTWDLVDGNEVIGVCIHMVTHWSWVVWSRHSRKAEGRTSTLREAKAIVESHVTSTSVKFIEGL